MHDHGPSTVQRARRLRREMSLPEGLLWSQLRAKSFGVKFRNQHPVDDFVVDFFCHAAKLAIEIDGISHEMGDQAAFDVRRDARLRELGLSVIRIPATEVLRDPVAVAESIVSHCLDCPPPSGLQPATSPGGGVSSGVAH